MPSFKPIILPSGRRKDGTWPVYIRITHHGRSRRIQTSLVCYQSDVTRGGKIKSQQIMSQGTALADRMRAAISDITPFELDEMDVDEVTLRVADALRAESFRLDFFAFGEAYAATKSVSTGMTYFVAMNAFARFLGRRTIDVNEITRQMLLEFVDWNEGQNKAHKSGKAASTKKIPLGSSARHIAKLRHLYEAAKERYNDEDRGIIVIPRSPFDRISRHQPPSHGQDALPVELLRKILTAETESNLERTALDAFALSLLLMGANLADLYRARPFSGKTWKYNRKKTETRRADRAEMQVEVPDEAAAFIASLRSRGDADAWWLPALHVVGKDGDSCTRMVNRGLRRWCDREGVQRFTFYAARHSWATLARRLGVEKATVDDCLCHLGDFALADIYAERAWNLMTAANRKVVDHLYDGGSGLSST